MLGVGDYMLGLRGFCIDLSSVKEAIQKFELGMF